MSLGLYFDSTVVFSKFSCSKTRFHFPLHDSISGHKYFNGKYQLNFPTGSSTGDMLVLSKVILRNLAALPFRGVEFHIM